VGLAEGAPIMSRYYFHIREGRFFVSDDEGIECRNLSAVQSEARSSAIDLANAALRSGEIAASIEIEDEDGNSLANIKAISLLN
jgi:hypothetical protein